MAQTPRGDTPAMPCRDVRYAVVKWAAWLVNYIVCVVVIKLPDRNNLQKERCILDHGFRRVRSREGAAGFAAVPACGGGYSYHSRP